MQLLNRKFWVLGFLLIGCINKGAVADNGLKRMVIDGDNKLLVEVKPTAKNDFRELIFQAQFLLSKDQVPQDKDFSQNLQYRLDSSFYLVSNKDTTWPLYVLPVANGQPYKPLYIVAFDRACLNHHEILFKSNIKGIELNEQSDLIFNSQKIKASIND